MSYRCEIRFDDSNGIYYPGQILSGYVVLRILKAMKVKEVDLQIEGVAEVRWSEKEPFGRRSHYHGRHQFINYTTTLTESSNGNNINLLPDMYTYPFSYALPSNLAASLEAALGYIRYTAKVTLYRSWKPSRPYKVPFKVVRHVNLNDEIFHVRLPRKMGWFFSCGSAPVVIVAETTVSGYVPGETIRVNIEVDNQSNKNLRELVIKLIQDVSFISRTPYTQVKTVSKIMAKVRCAEIEKQTKYSYIQHLNIPHLLPPSCPCNICQVMKVEYFVKVVEKTSGTSTRIPITMGTIPLTINTVSACVIAPAQPMVPAPIQPMAPTPDAQTQLFNDDLPPLSYEEAINGTGDIKQDGEEPN